MIKAIGAVCILTAAVWGWCRQFQERRRKWDTLRDLLRLLRRMGEEIRMRRTNLPQLMEELSRQESGYASQFFSHMAALLRAGEPFQESWRNAVLILQLEPEEQSAVLALGDSLQGDEEEACKAIRLTGAFLERSLAETRSHRTETEKRGAALWLSAGALLVIFLI